MPVYLPYLITLLKQLLRGLKIFGDGRALLIVCVSDLDCLNARGPKVFVTVYKRVILQYPGGSYSDHLFLESAKIVGEF